MSYRDGITFTWQNGRQLASLQTDDNSVSYKYDSNGMRTQKTDNSGTTYYYYDSNNNLIGLTKGNSTLLFYYDSDGNVTSFKYNGTMYYYIKNLQGDIVKILDQSGTEVAGYVYDAWGNIKNTTGNATLKELNPFRYRGYVYDEETRLYYLQSRYYDPFTGRFINADIYCDTQSGTPLSTNMFAYCENNSIMGTDYTGQWDSELHKTISYDNGFKNPAYATALDWTYNADAYPCESCDDYSAPFHARDKALDIATKLYNLAMDIKMTKKAKNFTIGKEKRNYTTVNFLKYTTKKGGSKKETKKAQNDFLKKINVRKWNEQSQILLGLALHTFQDYFAHVVEVDVYRTKGNVFPKKGWYSLTSYINLMICKVDDEKYMNLGNAIEDDPTVFSWRYTESRNITKALEKAWSKNKKIDYKHSVDYKTAYLYSRKANSFYWLIKSNINKVKIKYVI